MISAETVAKDNDPIQVSITVLETTQSQLGKKARTDESVHSLAPYRLNLSGSQLLVGFTSIFSGVGLLLWAFVRLWLFAP